MENITAKKIKALLTKDHIKEALDLLPSYLKNSEDLNSAVVQSAIYNRLINAMRRNTIDWDKAGVVKNQIIISILNIINLAEKASDESVRYSNVYSEIDSLKESVSAIPDKNTSITRFLNIQTSIIALLAFTAIAFGSGIVVGNTVINHGDTITNGDSTKPDTKQSSPTDSLCQKQLTISENDLRTAENQLNLFKTQNDSLKQAFKVTKKELTDCKGISQKPNIGIRDNTRYAGSGDHIRFLNQKGNTFEFVGEIASKSIAGIATLKGNKLSLSGGTVDGILNLSRDELFGQLNVSYRKGGQKYPEDVNLTIR